MDQKSNHNAGSTTTADQDSQTTALPCQQQDSFASKPTGSSHHADKANSEILCATEQDAKALHTFDAANAKL